ncbi:hypothetical protein FACS1894124_0670 [Spirochaetia bacterium]|nr:hypothetical protein FACS1894124_0670 [Spirochaetia bacterium]
MKTNVTKKQRQAMERLLKRYHKTGKPILPLMPTKQEGWHDKKAEAGLFSRPNSKTTEDQ